MTFKEKLMQEHPEKAIKNEYCFGCPSEYGYEAEQSCKKRPISCIDCWNRETFEEMTADTQPHILDSGTRREFETGAVRDIQAGKGRCDLLPLDVVAEFMSDPLLLYISRFQEDGAIRHLYDALTEGVLVAGFQTNFNMLLEVAKHFEEGCNKYGDNNWQKGIPTKCYIDSAVRHYLKYLRGDKDEPHDRAFCWNILCCIWTCIHKPELNDYGKEHE